MRRSLVLGSLVAGVMLLGACGDDGDGSDDGTTIDEDAVVSEGVVRLEGDSVRVIAQDNEFVEAGISIDAGTTVEWENVGRQDHDLLPGRGGAGWGVEQDGFDPGSVYEHTFDEPGVYHYYCSLHGDEEVGMVGVVVVE